MFWAILVAGCDDTLFSNGSGSDVPVTGHTYNDMKAIFANDCYVCHGSEDPLGELDLQTDACAALVDVAAFESGNVLVKPGNHAASELWVRMSNGDATLSLMPPTGKLNDSTIGAVADWIDLGASCGGDTGDSGDGEADGGGN